MRNQAGNANLPVCFIGLSRVHKTRGGKTYGIAEMASLKHLGKVLLMGKEEGHSLLLSFSCLVVKRYFTLYGKRAS